jgi:glycosyltransferase involved in cell wall biosynthesis
MKYSLIIPACDAEKTIASCLESALNQSLSREDYEIIVVDDGSTDNTPGIVKKYPVRLIQQKNQGRAAARNRGIKDARGDILVFTDSDCELDFDFIKNIIFPIEQENEIVGVQGSYGTKQEGLMARFAQAEIEIRYKRMAKNKYIDFIGTYAAAYKRGVFQKYGGFDIGFPVGEDTDFSYRLHQKGHKMIFVSEAFVYHRHPAKLTHYLKSKFYRGYWRMRLYRKYPKTMIRDSYVPQSLKLQVLSIPLLFFFGFLSLSSIFWLLPLFLIIVFFLFCSIPFYKIFKERKYPNSPLVPSILFLRAIALLLGILFGMANELIGFLTKG